MSELCLVGSLSSSERTYSYDVLQILLFFKVLFIVFSCILKLQDTLYKYLLRICRISVLTLCVNGWRYIPLPSARQPVCIMLLVDIMIGMCGRKVPTCVRDIILSLDGFRVVNACELNLEVKRDTRLVTLIPDEVGGVRRPPSAGAGQSLWQTLGRGAAAEPLHGPTNKNTSRTVIVFSDRP